MKKYRMIVRLRINIGRPVTDFDLRAMDCYFESPVFLADSSEYPVYVVEDAYMKFYSEHRDFRHLDSVELVEIA